MTEQLIDGSSSPPSIAIVVPCYNEEAVLDVTAHCMTEIMEDLQACGVMSVQSIINLMNDGSHDATRSIIERLSGPDNRKVVQ